MTNPDPKMQAALDQWDLFVAQQPELLKRFRGKWVLFRDGIAVPFGNEDEAYEAGVKTYGLTGDFIVAQVTEQQTPTVVLFSRS